MRKDCHSFSKTKSPVQCSSSFPVSSSLIAIMAQRLIRRICPNCKQEYKPTAHEMRELGLLNQDLPDVGTFYHGVGCDRCFQTGYRGRTGIYELLLIDEKTQEMIYQQQTAGAIKRAALDHGLQTLRMDGVRKVLGGQTTINEVLRVTQADVF